MKERHLAQLHLDHATRHVKAAADCIMRHEDTATLAHLRDAREDLRWSILYARLLAEAEAAK